MNPGMHEFLAQDRVIWGKPATQAVLEETERRGAKRVFIVTSRTLNTRTDVIERLREALGERYAATFDACIEHTPRASVIAAAEAARAARPDLVLTVGGGTAIDTVKVMLIALAHGVTRPEDLEAHHTRAPGARRVPGPRPPPFRQIVVSTTLSAAEYSDLGGCTDPIRKVKDAYVGREIGAASVILDPEVTTHTPEWLWLSTALRAIDHAVEGICSVQHSPLIEACGLHALRLFAKSLQRTREAPHDLAARLDCLHAAWMSGLGVMRVPYGASHGIGHSLGAVTGMSHGYTSCIMLTHVMRWNLEATREAQARIAAAMGRADGDASAAVAELVARLGLPARLRDLKVERAQLAQIAAGAMENMWVRTNPRPIRGEADLMALLEAAW